MIGVALERVTVQVSAEKAFAEIDGLGRIGAIQAMRLPGLFPRLHNDGREILAELVSMDLEPNRARSARMQR